MSLLPNGVPTLRCERGHPVTIKRNRKRESTPAGVDGEVTSVVMTELKVEEYRNRMLLWEQKTRSLPG